MPFLDHFAHRPALIGMIHIAALPGTPRYGGSMQSIIESALRDAATLKEAGFDALMIENMHDLPYLNRTVGPEIVAPMAVVGYLVKNAFRLPTGIQILAGANEAALACALASGLDFIRAEGFVFGHLADEGWMDADAGALLRYRRQIGAGQVHVLCDIKKKHSAHALTADISIADTAKAAEFFLSDGIIVTGKATGEEADIAELTSLRHATSLPLVVGSGITTENIHRYAPHCDAMIIGTSIKHGGNWANPVDFERARQLVMAVRGK